MADRTPDASNVVRDGYDRLGARYRDWSLDAGSEIRDRWLDAFEHSLPEHATVLDLGCGPGLVAARLAGRFDVLGVDLSEQQLALARRAAPRATFLATDMTTLELPAASVDGVVALFSLIHLASDALPAMLGRIATWLRPGGMLLATLGTIDGDGVQQDWLGVPMFFGGSTPARNRVLVEAAGLNLDRDDVTTIVEPEEGEIAFHWLLARKPVVAVGQGG